MSLTIFSQRDPQWVGLPLGNSDLTIGDFGCYLTTDAMILGQIPGVAISPRNLNDKLKDLGRFSGALLSSDAAIDGLYGAHYVETKWEPNAADLSYPQDSTTEQYAIEIFINGNSSLIHFVLYYDGHTNEDIRVVDPWNGDICHLTRYGHPQTIIQKWVHYTIPGNPIPPPPLAPAPGATPQVVASVPTPDPVAAPEPVPAAAQPSEPISDPEYKRTYKDDPSVQITKQDAVALDMTGAGALINVPKGTSVDIAGSFTDNGKEYVRTVHSRDNNKWYGLPFEAFQEPTGQVPETQIPITVIPGSTVGSVLADEPTGTPNDLTPPKSTLSLGDAFWSILGLILRPLGKLLRRK